MVEKRIPVQNPEADNQNPEDMLAIIRARTQAKKPSDMKATSTRTGELVLLLGGFFTADPVTGEWEFISREEPKKSGEYKILVADLIKSPEALCDWLAQISEISWFDPAKFFDFFRRFRKENDLFNSL